MAEVAGLVLGAIPLLVVGMQGYADAIEKIKRARKYTSILRQYNDDLELEGAALQNTWFKIIRLGQDAIIQRFPSLNLEELQKNPQQTMDAHKMTLETILKLALPDKEQYLEAIVRTFEGLYKLVTTLAENFGVIIDSHENPKVCSTNITLSIVNLNYLCSWYLAYISNALLIGAAANGQKRLQEEVKKNDGDVRN